MMADWYLQTELKSALEECCDGVQSIVGFLSPAYHTTSSGSLMSATECSAIAKIVGNVMPSILATIVHSLIATLSEWDDKCKGDISGRPTRVPSSTLHGVRITILCHALVIMRFLLQHMAFRCQAAACITLLHEAHFFPFCSDLLLGLTDHFQLLSAAGGSILSSPAARQQALLCCAVLGSTLAAYDTAVQFASSETTDQPARASDQMAGAPDETARASALYSSRYPVWNQLQVHTCHTHYTQSHITPRHRGGRGHSLQGSISHVPGLALSHPGLGASGENQAGCVTVLPGWLVFAS